MTKTLVEGLREPIISAAADAGTLTDLTLAERLVRERDAAASRIEELERALGEPVAWQVKDYADGWISYYSEERARQEAEEMGGALVRPLFAPRLSDKG
jgi:hypothetical protein